MKQKMQQQRLEEKEDEMERARMLISEMELMCKFISLLMSMISELQ